MRRQHKNIGEMHNILQLHEGGKMTSQTPKFGITAAHSLSHTKNEIPNHGGMKRATQLVRENAPTISSCVKEQTPG